MRMFMTVCVVLVAAFSLGAQVPASTVPNTLSVPALPVLDDLEKAWVETAQVAQSYANAQCQELPAVKQYNQTLMVIVSRIEGKHPVGSTGCPTGCTLDVGTGRLVPKAPK